MYKILYSISTKYFKGSECKNILGSEYKICTRVQKCTQNLFAKKVPNVGSGTSLVATSNFKRLEVQIELEVLRGFFARHELSMIYSE